jgi:hypothetical protein
MTVDEIKVAAEEIGYALPSDVPASAFPTFKYRN